MPSISSPLTVDTTSIPSEVTVILKLLSPTPISIPSAIAVSFILKTPVSAILPSESVITFLAVSIALSAPTLMRVLFSVSATEATKPERPTNVAPAASSTPSSKVDPSKVRFVNSGKSCILKIVLSGSAGSAPFNSGFSFASRKKSHLY